MKKMYLRNNLNYYYDYSKNILYIRELKKMISIKCTSSQYIKFVSYYSNLFNNEPFIVDKNTLTDLDSVYYSWLEKIHAVFNSEIDTIKMNSKLFKLIKEYSDNPDKVYQNMCTKKINIIGIDNKNFYYKMKKNFIEFGFNFSNSNMLEKSSDFNIEFIREIPQDSITAFKGDIIVICQKNNTLAFVNPNNKKMSKTKVSYIKKILLHPISDYYKNELAQKILIHILPFFICFAMHPNIKATMLIFDENCYPKYIY